jgi:Flp pilus assembly protein TadD
MFPGVTAMSALRALSTLAVVAFLALGGTALAAGSSTTTTEESGAFAEGKKAVADQNWAEAISQFKMATQQSPNDADAWNMLAYSYRMSGDIEAAFANYQTALAIDPDHKDANEYIGEAYLQIGDLAGAQKHLDKLDEICWLGCEQEDQLAAAIESWKAANN